VIVSTVPETMPAEVRIRRKAAGSTPMQGLEECLFAIHAADIIGRAQRDADKVLPVMKPVPVQGEPESLDEWQSKQELSRHGLQIPEGRLCDGDETVKAAAALGFPVVLKAVSRELAHKSELGAVVINLSDDAAVTEAAAAMAENFDCFLVEKMAGPAVAEIIIGVSRDATFGLTVLLGAGGTLVELLDDTASLLLPVQRQEIETAISTLKVANLIDAYRGGQKGDLGAIVDAVIAVAAYAIENNNTLAELDVNPLIVMPGGAIAVDAYIRRSDGKA